MRRAGAATGAARCAHTITTGRTHAYNDALTGFRDVLRERRAQLTSHQPLPSLPGQALYLARIRMMSAYKDLTDAVPAKIGRANKFGIPPAYFDADSNR